MKLPRWQLFEFNDAPWAPEVLKQSIIESLSRTIHWGRMLRGLVEPFTAFMAATGKDEILDLASGAGGPAAILVKAMQEQGRVPPRILLTDLQPQLDAWQKLKERFAGTIDYAPQPVDMTAIPAALSGERPRCIINALHHFPPDVARTLLRGAAEGSSGLFIAEGLTRNPLRATAVAMTGVPAVLLNPLLAEDHQLSKLLWTWPVPLALAAGIWDGAVSSMRSYTEAELLELVQPWGRGWHWTSGEFTYRPWGKGSYFWGVPAPRGASMP
jgi:hypothetical protein